MTTLRSRRTIAGAAVGVLLASAAALPVAAVTKVPHASDRARVATLLSGIHYDTAKLGATIVLAGARDGILGVTDTATKTITLYVRSGESTAFLRKVLAYELGHVVDITYNTKKTRATWLRMRHAAAGTTWFAPDLAPENAYGSGDFADVFSSYATGSALFWSTVHAKPSATSIKGLVKFFHRGDALPATVTAITSTVTGPVEDGVPAVVDSNDPVRPPWPGDADPGAFR